MEPKKNVKDLSHSTDFIQHNNISSDYENEFTNLAQFPKNKVKETTYKLSPSIAQYDKHRQIESRSYNFYNRLVYMYYIISN